MATIAEVLGIVVGLLGLWEFLARTDVVPGPSPVQRVAPGPSTAARVDRTSDDFADLGGESGTLDDFLDAGLRDQRETLENFLDADRRGERRNEASRSTPLAAPTGLTLVGGCESGFTLRWAPVPGATSYEIERDGVFRGSEWGGTEFQFTEFPDERSHEYRVIAKDPPRESAVSADSVEAGPCSF